MNAITLREVMTSFLPPNLIKTRDHELGGSKRSRKRDVVALAASVVMTAGSDDSGRQADIFTTYLTSASKTVSRSAFYSWFTTPFALVMLSLLRDAIDHVNKLPPLLDGALAGMKDWRIVDSETIRLRPALEWLFPATSTKAALKIHKVFSLGRNNIIDFHISPAREHDSPHLEIDESWRGTGLLIDLGYASLDRIRKCRMHGVGLVMRLKSGWKPSLLRLAREGGELVELEGHPVCARLLDLPASPASRPWDFDVAFGKGTSRVEARLVSVPAEDGFHWCITLLPREKYSPELVCQLYRARWEIERDNRREKGAARLDQLKATKPASVFALLYGSLLRNLLSNYLVYCDLRDRPPKRAPLHGFSLSLALVSVSQLVLLAVMWSTEEVWSRLAGVLRARGKDPNWRHRPSHLDQLRGTTAPRGRPRKVPLRSCPPEARAYRQNQTLVNLHKWAA